MTNGSAGDTTALITGHLFGVLVYGASATISNYGTILGTGGYGYVTGAFLHAGGMVTNGSATDTTALIEGYNGLYAKGASTAVTNFGTIEGSAGYGVRLVAGGSLINGSATDVTARVEGYRGVGAIKSATIANFGTIESTGSSVYGVHLSVGGSLTNGSATDTTALIVGDVGFGTNGVATVINFGTISGTGGTAVQFNSASEVLVVEAGSAFLGAVQGHGGTLDLASGTGTISNSGGTAIVSGSMATTTFSNFGTVEISGGAHFTKALIGDYPGGYALSATYAGLIIESAATVGGAGVSASFNTTIQNYGSVNATGSSDGVLLTAGGAVTNGSATDTTALISGYSGVRVSGASATVANFGAIQGGYFGVYLTAGGSVTNGSTGHTTALISGYSGVVTTGASATIANYGTIRGSSYYGAGVQLNAGGMVTNGSASSTTALIYGKYDGVFATGASATITNYGTIHGYFGYGVILAAGGTVANFGTIQGGQYSAVGLTAGGNVTNGSTSDTTARIGSYYGVKASGASATIANYGTIQCKFSYGVSLTAGGTVTNGSAGDTTALIGGIYGVFATGAAVAVVNFGTSRAASSPPARRPRSPTTARSTAKASVWGPVGR